MNHAIGPLLKTLLFTVLVPGTVLGYVPYRMTGGFAHPVGGAFTILGIALMLIGAAIYFRCAWEFAVRGLGTPAPIAPTKYLVTTALHRYIRNPMYVGVFLVLIGETVWFWSKTLVAYGAFLCVAVQSFVVFYEEPTLHRQFGESYDSYRRAVPRWIPHFWRRRPS